VDQQIESITFRIALNDGLELFFVQTKYLSHRRRQLIQEATVFLT
jgi:hypothetical protein